MSLETTFAQIFDCKIKCQRSAESLQLLNRWIAEYNQLESENPRAKSNHNLETLRKTFASEPPTKLDAEGMMKTCSRRSDETLKAFESLKPKLQTLLVMWTEWETELLRLEDIAKDGIANRTNTMRDEMEAIRTIESKYDELVPLLSASARLASNQRLELLRMKVRHLSRNCRSSYPLEWRFSRGARSLALQVRLQRSDNCWTAPIVSLALALRSVLVPFGHAQRTHREKNPPCAPSL
ncbi:hypothetical protein ANCCEY_06190 [Ancylostoma ceylanicum]|uniref:Uncharacterized protein n=1 Tax=Ancylostoma ceylanicum TaxID=53326 RepID=A0A0D6M464_9BILA|nr:hypothetical protein ANCCEY_06190 [Ancylostoma ceylanicum]